MSAAPTSTAALAPSPVPVLVSEPTAGPTAAPQPTPTPSPTPGPRPGYDRDSALAIDLDEAASASLSIFNRGPHFYEVQFEEGATYTTTIDLSPDTILSLTVALADNETEALALAFVGRDLASSFIWTAKASGSYFVIVSGLGSGSYTLTVTESTIAGSPTLIETVTPGISSTPLPTATPGISPSPTPTPSPSAPSLAFTAVSAGGEHTCGITASGAANCWGYGADGQLGDGSKLDITTPLAVSGGLAFDAISAGDRHTCGVTISGGAYCWGRGDDGQLGNGSTERPDDTGGCLGRAHLRRGKCG